MPTLFVFSQSIMTQSNRQAVLRAYFLFRIIAPFVFAMWLAVAPLYFAMYITADPFQLAMIGVVLEAATFLFEIPTGIVADMYSRKWSIVIGYLIWGFGFIMQGATQDFYLILLSQVIWGLGFTFVSGAPEAWLVDELGQDEAMPLFVRGTQVGQVASILGILSAMILGMGFIGLPIIVGGIGTIILAILLMVIMPETDFRVTTPTHERSHWHPLQTFRMGMSAIQQRPVLRSAIYIGTIIGLFVGGFDAMYPAHITQNYVMPFLPPVVWFGLLSGGVSLLTIIALEIVKRRLKYSSLLAVSSLLALFALGTVIGNLLFVWTRYFYVMFFAFWFSQTLRNATKPLFMAWINQHAPSSVRATIISMYWQSNAFGQLVGTPILGMIGSMVTLRAALSISALGLSPVILIYRKHRHHPES